MPVADPSRCAAADEVAELRRAWRLHRAAGLWRVAATLATASGLVSLTLGGGIAAMWEPRLGVLAAIVAVTSLPLLLAFWSRARARKATDSTRAALDQAWLLTAQTVLAQRGENLSLEALGRLLGADSKDAEHWLTQLGASDEVTARIDDAGEIVYVHRASTARISEQAMGTQSDLSREQASERRRLN